MLQGVLIFKIWKRRANLTVAMVAGYYQRPAAAVAVGAIINPTWLISFGTARPTANSIPAALRPLLRGFISGGGANAWPVCNAAAMAAYTPSIPAAALYDGSPVGAPAVPAGMPAAQAATYNDWKYDLFKMQSYVQKHLR